MKHLMDVWMGEMLIQSSPRGIGVWEGKNLLSMFLFSCFVLFGRGWLIVGGLLPLEHPHP